MRNNSFVQMYYGTLHKVVEWDFTRPRKNGQNYKKGHFFQKLLQKRSLFDKKGHFIIMFTIVAFYMLKIYDFDVHAYVHLLIMLLI